MRFYRNEWGTRKTCKYTQLVVWKKRLQRGGREGETTIPDWRPGLGMKTQEAIVLQKWQMARRTILDNDRKIKALTHISRNDNEKSKYKPHGPVRKWKTLGSVGDHHDGVDNNRKNMHTWQWKAVLVLHALYERFPFLYILQPFLANHRREKWLFAFVWTISALGYNSVFNAIHLQTHLPI